jgi:hypothetical protein
LNQHKNLDKIWRQREDNQYVHGLRFESPYFGPEQQADDAVAKKTFSGYGFSSLWTKTIKSSWKLQLERLPGSSFVIWPTNESTDDSSSIIEEGRRCSCEQRIAFQIQCEHEYVMDGRIDIFKMTPRGTIVKHLINCSPQIASVFPADTNQNRYNHLNESNAVFDNSVNDDGGNSLANHSLPSDNGDPMEPGDPMDDDSRDQFYQGYPSSRLLLSVKKLLTSTFKNAHLNWLGLAKMINQK